MALLSLLAQLWLCQFFSTTPQGEFGNLVPVSIDVNPSNLWKQAYHFPPIGSFLVLNWLGQALLPVPLNPFSAAANLPTWWFFTAYAPMVATCSLLAMAIFLRELELPRPAALFGGVVYAWQGDLLPFVYPGHYGYITTWPFFALAAWGALRSQRLRHWAYALISGVSCGLMVGLQPDRGGIASLLIAALYLAPALRPEVGWRTPLRHLALCAGAAFLISLAPLLALFQGNIVGVKLGGETDRERTYDLVTQYSLGPGETLTYLVPGFFGWFTGSNDAAYWGWIGESQEWPTTHQGEKNSNLAISTTGTVATVLALIGAILLLPGSPAGILGPGDISPRQKLFGRVLLALGVVTLVLAWGWHTPFYRPLFALPLMDKWRNPLKWLEMTNFAIATLSAFGLRHLILSLEPGADRVRRGLFWFNTAMLGALGLFFLVSYPFTLILRNVLQVEGYGDVEIAHIVATVHSSLFFAVVLMAIYCAVLHALWRPEPLLGWKIPNPFLDRVRAAALRPENLPLTLAVLLSVLVVAQMGWVAGKFLDFLPEPERLSALTATNPLLEELRSEGDQVRVSVATQDPVLNVMLLNQFAGDRISCLEISAASRVPDDLTAFFDAFGQDRGRLWFLTGVKNVVLPREFMLQVQHDPRIAPNIDHADGYMLVPTPSPDLPSHALIALRDYMAKATFVPDAEFFPSNDDILKRLPDPTWNPRATVLLNIADGKPAPPQAYVSSLPARADVKLYTPNEIDVSLWTPRSGFLLVNDQYDPDWQATVDGKPAELLKADDILRAVRVPQGDSEVVMRYATRYHFGAILRQMTGLNLGDASVSAEWLNNFCDAAMLAAWIVAGVAIWRSRRGEKVSPVEKLPENSTGVSP
ncbi:MAG: YfhO family protein [Methylacidiphilales bacterium]|nr:YfhO family protein [Candidatus Methylacidiphilales bacterium]